MSEHLCPRCWAATPDGLLCAVCTSRLRGLLRHLPDLVHEADVTATRQSRTGNGAGRHNGTPLPFDWNASDAVWAARNTLGTWVRDLAERHGEHLYALVAGGHAALIAPTVDGTTLDMTRWLTERLHRIRAHPAVTQLIDELEYTRWSLRQVVDRPADREYVTECVICGHGVYGPAEAPDQAWIPCAECRRVADRDTDGNLTGYIPEYQVGAARQARMLRLLESNLTAAELIPALSVLRGQPVNGKTIRSWVRRGRLEPVACRVLHELPLYAVRDAMRLAAQIPRDTLLMAGA